MSVNLSPVGGAAAQFFDNNGNPLSGGKLYTYAAGTTTPLAAYTTSAGNVPHTNPIILDSAGRVPGGQIWLTVGDVDYKFLLETLANVLIGTFDNISPTLSGNASDTTAVASTYNAGITVQAQLTNVGSATGAINVGFTPAGAGAVATTVQAVLRESVSVTQFGASPSKTAAQNQSAFVLALAAADSIRVPAGTFKLTGNLNITGKAIIGESRFSSILLLDGLNTNVSLLINGGDINTSWGTGGGCTLRNLTLKGNWDSAASNAATDISMIGGLFKWWAGAYVNIDGCEIQSSFGFGVFCYPLGYSSIQNNHVYLTAKNGVHLQALDGSVGVTSTSVIGNSIHTCRGTGATGGSSLSIQNGFSVQTSFNTFEDVENGVRFDGQDNRSNGVFQNTFAQTSVSGINHVGSGNGLSIIQNVFEALPSVLMPNPEFKRYTSFGNFNLVDQYLLPRLKGGPNQVTITAASPKATIAQVTLTPGTWDVSASWNGQQSDGVGQFSTRQEFAINNSPAIPSYSSTFNMSTLRGDCVSSTNEANGFLNGSLSTVITVTSNTIIYLYGGASSITNTLAVSVAGYITAVKVGDAI